MKNMLFTLKCCPLNILLYYTSWVWFVGVIITESCVALFYCLIVVETIKTEAKSGPETHEPVTDTASTATVTATVQPEVKLSSQSSTSSLEDEEEDIEEPMLKPGQEKLKYLPTERAETSVKPPTTTGNKLFIYFI